MSNRLNGKTALVSGAARGIGAATAELFAAEGAAVVLTDVRDDLGEAVAERIRHRRLAGARRRLLGRREPAAGRELLNLYDENGAQT